MKRFGFFVTLFFCFSAVNAQFPIDEKASIKKVDEVQSKASIEYLMRKYFNKSVLGFTMKNHDWMYVLSYEPKENYNNYGRRKAFLYKRKINDIGNWEKVNINPVFEHAYTRTIKMSFDNNRWHNETSPGISAVERVDTDNGTCIVMFVGILLIQGIDLKEYTHFVFFYPRKKNPDGSIFFEYKEWGNNFTKFKYTGREGNVFHDAGKKFQIMFDYRYDKANGKLMPFDKRVD